MAPMSCFDDTHKPRGWGECSGLVASISAGVCSRVGRPSGIFLQLCSQVFSNHESRSEKSEKSAYFSRTFSRAAFSLTQGSVE